ncbi:MAG: restriction endonuclease subunit S [Magnetococcales bacterium]|nr:restriction endonuclease subunit S [Magnetococcales bacterium]
MSNKTGVSTVKQESKRELKPKLRFPEFRDAGGWSIKLLGNVCENLDSKRVPITETDRIKGDIPYYGASGVIDHVKHYIFDDDLLCISEDGANLVARTYPVAFSISGKTWVNNHAHVLKFADGYAKVIVENHLNSISLENFLTGMAQPKLNRAKLDVIPIPLPGAAEQQKIADCLSSLDELITAHTQKLVTLKDHKKGLMQQIFPAEGETLPKLRFPEFQDTGAWEKDELGKVADFVGERMPLEQLKLANYVSTENILPDYEGLTNASKLPSSGSVTRFTANDILISNIRPYLKKVWFSDKDGGASNDVIVIRAKDELINLYLSFILKNDSFIDYVMKGAKGVKMPRGDISLMREYPLAYPSDFEQQKIADCLSSLDELITAQTQMLETLKTHKKGLMQQLFPSTEGEIQV